jgi:hypothetical protein
VFRRLWILLVASIEQSKGGPFFTLVTRRCPVGKRISFVVVAFLGALGAPSVTSAGEGATERKLQQAFPNDQQASSAAIKVNVRAQGLVFAADSATVEPDGRIKLSNCAIAQFPRQDAGGKTIRPTTIRSEYAYLKYDGPVRSIVDLVIRKILAVELPGGATMKLGGE